MLTMQLNAFGHHWRRLAKEKPQYKGRGKLTEQMRKRLAGSMRSAMISRSKLSDKTKAAWLLQKDILNCVLHRFGSNKKCRADFCKVVQKARSSQCKETSLAISDEQSAITELDSSCCNELLLSNDSSTSSWTSLFP